MFDNPTISQSSASGYLKIFDRILRLFSANEGTTKTVNELCTILGHSMSVDRCIIYENQSSEGMLYYSLMPGSWHSSSLANQGLSASQPGLKASAIADAHKSFQRGDLVLGVTQESLQLDFRHSLEERHCLSYLYIPIMSSDQVWGFLGIEDCRNERRWTEEDILLVKSVSVLMGQYLDRTRISRDLVDREEKLEIALEAGNDGHWEINHIANSIYLSRQWKNMLGFEESELTNDFATFESLIHPEDRQETLEALDPFVSNTNRNFDLEYRLRSRSGEYIWVLTQAYVHVDDSGIPISTRGTNINITSHVNFNENLKKKEEAYQDLVNSVHEIIFRITSEGVISFINPAWQEITGFTTKHCVGTQILNYIHPSDRSLAQQYFERAKRPDSSGKSEFEARFLTSRGFPVWTHIHLTHDQPSEGESRDLYGTIMDIHQRKMAEIAKEESDERFQLVSDTMSDLITLHAPDATLNYVSPSIKELLGYMPEEVIGRSPLDFVHPEDREKLETAIFRPVIEGTMEKAVTEARLANSKGEYNWFEAIIQPIYHEDELEGILSVARDITERKRFQNEIQKALEKEKELNELKSTFISMASHEFRTPLTSIKSSVDMLGLYAEELGSHRNSPLQKHFEKINHQIDRLSNLMNDVLILGKTDANKIPFEPEKTDLTHLCQHIIERQFSNEEDERTVDVSFSGKRQKVEVDSSLFEHIITNLCSNALKYSMGKGNPRLSLDYREDAVVIEVCDEGIGIPESEQSQLFNSFFRAKNASVYDGTGLGLVIVDEFMSLHGGQIEVESEENKGTCVRLTLGYELKKPRD